MTYGKKVLIAFDQLVNALAGGWPDETLSSRAWRWEKNGVRHGPGGSLICCFSLIPGTAGRATKANGWGDSSRQNSGV